jgi:hypothetical protein
VITSSPETRLGFGAAVAANFETDKIRDGITRTSYSMTYGIYTINKQYTAGNNSRIYFPRNKYILSSNVQFSYFPEYYYGIATESPLQHRDTISYDRTTADIRLYRQVKRNFYLGLASRYNRIANVRSGEGNFIAEKPLGYSGYWIQGFAPALTIETRDSFVYPRKGFFLETLYFVYPDWNGKSYQFQQMRLDARKYFPIQWISPIDVIALQLIACVYTGDVPFKDMADIGGNATRGYYSGYYRYKNLYTFQAEFRTKIAKRLGLTAWAGAALTPNSWNNPFENSVKPNGGIGLRFMINTKDLLNIRFDQGFGKQGQKGFYTDLAEAY